MISLEKKLIRLPRKPVSLDFISKVLQKIHEENATIWLTTTNKQNIAQYRHWQTEYYDTQSQEKISFEDTDLSFRKFYSIQKHGSYSHTRVDKNYIIANRNVQFMENER